MSPRMVQQVLLAAAGRSVDPQTIANKALAGGFGELSLPEVEKVIDLVARMAPAGNIPV